VVSCCCLLAANPGPTRDNAHTERGGRARDSDLVFPRPTTTGAVAGLPTAPRPRPKVSLRAGARGSDLVFLFLALPPSPSGPPRWHTATIPKWRWEARRSDLGAPRSDLVFPRPPTTGAVAGLPTAPRPTTTGAVAGLPTAPRPTTEGLPTSARVCGARGSERGGQI